MGSTPTVHDVAREAGVSIASVSRALSGKTRNEATIEAVRAAALKVGYHTNAVARSLQRQRTDQVVFAVSDIGNAAYLSMVRAIEPTIADADLGLLLRSTGGNPVLESKLVAELASRFADGMILAPLRVTSTLLDDLISSPTPVVVIASLPHGVPLDSVRTDSHAGAGMAVEHLLERGCTNIGFIGGPVDTGPGASRLLGYKDALRKAGIPNDDKNIELSGTFTFEGGRDAADKILSRAKIDGLLAANDHLAVGAIHSARARGVSVPDDVQVIGMDDSDLAVSFLPSITSVNLRARDRGKAAAELLISRIADPDRPHETIRLEPWLSRRGSTS